MFLVGMVSCWPEQVSKKRGIVWLSHCFETNIEVELRKKKATRQSGSQFKISRQVTE